jgi:uncharacterized damage-inducible protein DinB
MGVMTVDLNSATSQLDLLKTELIEVRNNLMTAIKGIDQDMLDFTPDQKTVESIATLLLHVAAIEWSWIFEDIFGEEMEYEKWKHAFALREGVDVDQIRDKPLGYFKEILIETRSQIFEALDRFEDKDLDRIFPEGKEEGRRFTLRWIIYHIIEHEAMHIGQISLLKRLYKINND